MVISRVKTTDERAARLCEKRRVAENGCQVAAS